MGRRRVPSWAWAWTILVASAAPRAVRADEDAKAWRDPEILEARLAEACDAVEKATGIPFSKRPTIRVSTTKEVVDILRVELAPAMKAMGESGSLAGALDLLAGGLLAKYEPATHVVHVIPTAVARMAGLLKEPLLENEDTLRVVLAHETTHAHDFAIYGWEKMRDTRSTQEGQQALNAMIEGHAQLVAEEVAAAWGLSDAFQRFTRSITAVPPIDDPTMKQIVEALATEVGFAYVQGHAFLKAVKAAKGLPGVEEALKHPPEGTRVVEHPEAWLDPKAAAKDVDLAALLDAMRPLVGDPAWKVGTDRILEAALETQRAAIPAEHRDAYLKGYQDGRVLGAQVPEEQVQVVLLAMRFAAPEDARAHAALERVMSEAKDAALKSGAIHIVSAAYVDGAGAENRLTGFRATKTLSVYGTEATVDTVLAVVDRVMIQILVSNVPELDRAAQDEALARGAAFVADPAAAASLPPLTSRPFKKKNATLTIRVLDGDGKPVPKAKAMLTEGDRPSEKDMESAPISAAPRGFRSSQSAEVEDGKAVFSHVNRSVTLDVWGAQAADGTPLAWAPARKENVAKDAGVVEVRLEPGATISGHVRTQDGKGIAGAEVRAVPKESAWRYHDDPLSKATTDAEGAFRLGGLAKAETVRVSVKPPAGFAVPPPVDPKGGDEAVAIVLKPGGSVTLTVVDWNAAPVEGAHVDVSAGPQWWTSREVAHGGTDAQGRVTLEGLESGAEYILHVLPPPHRGDLVPIMHREKWKPANETVRLERGYTIKGVVHDAQGAPAKAMVWRITGPGSTTT